ncbi:MAG: NAD(P)/FAD-dependent oxidoreductase [Eubacterium sp.]|nr:NAD(P)/FAD-dependent oxidoreductase [Eubacterium sp.]
MKTAIIGGGPAGMLAAASARASGCEAVLYEQNEKLGKKLYITGKGRCNVTNSCELSDFFDNIVTNKNFLYSALYTFTNDQLMALLEDNGCPLKTERGGRVFPKSDKSSDIIKTLQKMLVGAGVEVRLNTRVEEILVENGAVRGLRLEDGETVACDKVILATGGVSYRFTGADGSGLAMARALGHTVTDLRPSLVGVLTQEAWVKKLQGLALKNVGLTLVKGKKKVKTLMGEMLFTHFGVSGPLVLTASAYMNPPYEDYSLIIDLKPALSPEQMDQRLQRDFEKYHRKSFINGLGDLLPSKMIPVMVEYSGIPPQKVVNQITREERQRLAKAFKAMTLKVSGLQDINTAIITKGGVSVKEIDPGTMASRKVKGLYFAGEMIDVDALTGGFNIQIAASTGWLAGLSEEE